MSSVAVLWALLAQGGECSSVLEKARAAYESREFESSAIQFEQALTVCPDSTRVLLPLAQSQLMAQHLEPSRLTLERLLKIQPRNADAFKLYGDVLYLLGRESDAENALQSALKADAQHAPSRYSLARIRYQQSRYTEAADLFRSLLQQNPDDFRAHDNLALCYAALQQDSLAMQHFLKALELVHEKHPKYDTVYANAANFLLDRQQYEKAFQLAAEASQRNPGSARNFFLTGKALVKLDKEELSIRWLKQAAELDPLYSEPHYLLAQVYRKLDRPGEANAELEKFRELSKTPRVRR